jgi:hypothetical protein
MEQIFFYKVTWEIFKREARAENRGRQIKQKVWSTLPSDLLKINIPLDSLSNLVARVFPLKWRELPVWR